MNAPARPTDSRLAHSIFTKPESYTDINTLLPLLLDNVEDETPSTPDLYGQCLAMLNKLQERTSMDRLPR